MNLQKFFGFWGWSLQASWVLTTTPNSRSQIRLSWAVNRLYSTHNAVAMSLSCSSGWCAMEHRVIRNLAADGPHFTLFTSSSYCKTLNVCVPFISRAKQNREIRGRDYQLQAKKIGQNYYSILNYMVLIRQNKRGQNNFACKVANF